MTTEKPVKIAAGGVKKGRNEGTKAITGNRLTDGCAVYLTPDIKWSPRLHDAAEFEGDAALKALAAATEQEIEVVGPYLMDIETHGKSITPTGRGRLREFIRNQGPTIKSDYSL